MWGSNHADAGIAAAKHPGADGHWLDMARFLQRKPDQASAHTYARWSLVSEVSLLSHARGAMLCGKGATGVP
jgi:hypothetical protein